MSTNKKNSTRKEIEHGWEPNLKWIQSIMFKLSTRVGVNCVLVKNWAPISMGKEMSAGKNMSTDKEFFTHKELSCS